MDRLKQFYERLDMECKKALYFRNPEMVPITIAFFNLNEPQRHYLIKMTALKKKQGTFHRRWLADQILKFHQENFEQFHLTLHEMNNDSDSDRL